MNSPTSEKKKILITVKSPPYPSKQYRELVCTAGVTEDSEWIRIVPMPYRYLNGSKFEKFDWIELDIQKHDKDMRFETFRPTDLDKIEIVGNLSKENNWEERNVFLLPKISEKTLCDHVQDFRKKSDADNQYAAQSLFMIKPHEIMGLDIEKDDPDWKPEWQQLFEQEPLFDDMKMKPLDKIPFKFFYRFKCCPECKGHRIKIEDWEIVELARNYLDDTENLKQKVFEKYFDWMTQKREIYFFMGSTLQFHRRKSKNPFIIIGVFYPPKNDQQSLF